MRFEVFVESRDMFMVAKMYYQEFLILHTFTQQRFWIYVTKGSWTRSPVPWLTSPNVSNHLQTSPIISKRLQSLSSRHCTCFLPLPLSPPFPHQQLGDLAFRKGGYCQNRDTLPGTLRVPHIFTGCFQEKGPG